MEGLLLIGALIVTIVVAGAPPYFILGPLMRAIKDRPVPNQFRLSDLFCLIALAQLALAFLVSVLQMPDMEPAASTVMVVVALIVVALIWHGSLNALALAGVESTVRRSVFQVAVVPGTLAMAFGGVIAFWGTVITFCNLLRPSTSVLISLAVTFSVPFCVVVCYTLRRLTVWCVAGAFATIAALLSLSIPAAAQEVPSDPSRPNIVIISSDNLGYGDVGCYGNRRIETPAIDRLAETGVRCADFYTASPTCTVSRASLLTGRYPQRHGLTRQLPGLAGNYGVGLDRREVLIGQVLAEAGYATGCFGKWNIGFAPGSRPTERGFDEFLGCASGNIDYYSHVYNGRLDMHRGTEPVELDGYSPDLFAEAACEFIRRNAARPFFVYVPLNAPHFPNPKNKAPGQPCVWQAPDAAFAAYGIDPKTTDPLARYRAVVTAMDRAVGRVVDQIDALRLAEKTVIVFFSDNGAFMLKGRGLEVASNAPLRDGGVTLWEGGIRVVCVARWPERFPAGSVCREPLLSCDLFAMSARLAGAPGPTDRTIDGRDPTGALAGRARSPHEALYFRYGTAKAVRRGPYKLIQENPKRPWQLFDLSTDVAESHDLAADRPDRVHAMQADYAQWLATVEDN